MTSDVGHGDEMMKHWVALHLFTSRVRHDIEDIRDVIELAESNLKSEMKRLQERVDGELRGIADDDEREFASGWYEDDFVRLDKIYPEIQRRALFTTLMCVTEADMLLGCRMCKRAFEIPKEFKKKGNTRTIVQAMEYLRSHLDIRDRSLAPHWELLQNLWSIRNALVHNDGKAKPSERESIATFCDPIPTLELDHHGRIILKAGSVEMALHAVDLFFSRLIDEIKRNKLPNKALQAIGAPGSPQPEG